MGLISRGGEVQARVEAIKSIHELEPLIDEWSALVRSQPAYHYSQTYIYTHVAVEAALARGAKVRLVVARHSGRLIGVLPLIIRREGLLRVARPVSCGSHEEYSEPLVDIGWQDAALEAILLAALEISCDAILLTNVASGGGVAAMLGREPLKRAPKRTTMIAGYAMGVSRFASWEAYQQQSSSSRAASLRKKLRRLEQLGTVALGWSADPADASTVLKWLFETKREWAKRRQRHVPWLEEKNVPAFFQALVQRMNVIDLPLVVFLKFDGNVIAAQLNLVGGTAMESFIIARDEQFNRYSPGEILTEYCTKLAIERGLDFDFRIMSDDYKQKRSDVTTFYKNVEIYLTLMGRIFGPIQAEVSEMWAVVFRIYARFSRYAHGLGAHKA